MSLFNFLTKELYILLEPHQITVKDLKSGAEITRKPLEPYSCGRLIISDFRGFEDFLKSVISELFPKEGLFAPSYKMHVDLKHQFETALSEIEIRAVKDACEHAGAREVHINWENRY